MHKGSKIIQLCSGSAFLPQPEFASYAASKSYVLSFSRALGQEVKKKGITVTCVCPGPVNTEFFEAAGSEIAPAKKRFLVESKDVVQKAMKDAKAGKELSVYGISMKLVHLAGKFLPTRMVLSVMNKTMTKQ
jgi:short-subunit dehydrogenase